MKIKKLPIKIDKVDKIFHIADIHIRLFKRKEEYRSVFKTLYEEIKNEVTENSIIVIAGDIVHAKIEMSPELVQLTVELFSNLANICPTIITAGNHDCNLNNVSRLDAISPIVDALNHKNIFYLKDTGLYESGDCVFSVMSIFDDISEYILADKIASDKTKIAIFHGPIHLATTDTGWKITSEKVQTNLFDNFDIVLLGDIHKYQMLQPKTVLNGINKPAIYYPGSLIQQNYGESLDKHGMLIWDVESREHEFRKIKNEYGFVTIDIDGGKVLPDSLKDIPSKARMRLQINNTSQSQLKECMSELRNQYKPIEVIINRKSHKNELKEDEDRIDLSHIRNVDFQNKLLEDYINRNFNLDSNELDKIYEINKELNEQLPTQEIIRNITWKPKVFKFSNMFSYGPGNVIDFSKMNGIVGLFSSNASGKTSLIESLTFCLFDKCSKAFKAIHILNNRKDKFSCELLFEIAGEEYGIKRTASKSASGNVTVKVDFYKVLEDGTNFSLNGEQRRDTDSLIRSYIGTYEDFIMTAVSSQTNPINFIDKTQSERKDLLSAFMDINIFEQLYELGSEEVKEYNALLKEYKKNDYEGEILEYQTKIEKYQQDYVLLKDNKDVLAGQKLQFDEQLQKLYQQLISIDSEILDIKSLESTKTSNELSIKKHEIDLQSMILNLSAVKEKYNHLFQTVNTLDGQKIEQEYKKYIEITSKLTNFDQRFDKLKYEIKNKLDKTQKLRELKYDPNCEYCMNNIFVKDAILAKKELEEDKLKVENLLAERKKMQAELDELSMAKDEYEKYHKLSGELKSINVELLQLESKKNTISNTINDIKNKLEKIILKIEKYYKSIDDIEKNKIVEKEISEIKNKVSAINDELNDAEDELRDAHSKVIFLIDKKKTAEEALQTFKDMEEKNGLYQYYLQAIHRDAIPYELIAKAIPRIEKEINNILSQIVDFAVMLDLDGKNINAKIVYDEERYWPLEMASGMEKFVSALAIRVALSEISNLPLPNFLAIDEGFSALDADNSANLPTVFDYLKSQFDFVFIISHMDYIRDFVDISLDLKKQDDFSKIIF